MIQAVELALYVIWTANKQHKAITHLKLQKILYYLQGEFLRAFGRPLFSERIEAWQYGPVVPEVYYRFVSSGALNLTCTNNKSDVISSLSMEEQECIERVLDEKLSLSASALVSAVHKEKPWKELEASVLAGERPVISVDSMRSYFRGKP